MKSDEGVGSDRMSHGLKKGPWTAAEDAILMEYVQKHGEGNWNAVQKNSGLMRCGKSCRLRWANHLRPNLKKGSISPEEERIIIELHAKLGNKWARMAAQLPGRTDNEIKNYWNTRMKRRQRAGLPIYPQEVGDNKVAGFLQHQQQVQLDEQAAQHCQGRKRPIASTSNSSLPSFLSSSYHHHQSKKHVPNISSNFSFLDSMSFSSAGQNNHQAEVATSSFYPYPYPYLYRQSKLSHNNTTSNNINGFAPPLISSLSSSPFVVPPSSSDTYNENITAQLSAPTSFQFNSSSLSFSSLLMGAQTEPIVNVGPALEAAELAFSQTQTPAQPTTPTSSYTNSIDTGVCLKVASSGNTDNYSELKAAGSSGLLDALLLESRSLSRKSNGRNKDEGQVIDKGKGVLAMDAANFVEEEEELGDDDDNKCAVANHWQDDFSSSQSSSMTMGLKPSEESIDEMNSMDDDLLSLLNNFPSAMPLPEWYTKSARMSTQDNIYGA